MEEEAINPMQKAIDAAIDAAAARDATEYPSAEPAAPEPAKEEPAAEAGTTAAEPAAEPGPAAEPAPEPAPEPEQSAEPEPPAGISDEALERAIRSGLSIQNARKYKDDESLNEILDIIDQQRQGLGGEPNDDGRPDNYLDIPEDEDISPPLRTYIQKLEEMVKRHEATIQSLTEEDAARKIDAFSSKIDKLGEAYVPVLGTSEKLTAAQKENRAKLKSKYDMLSAGYRQTGTKASDDEIFREAVKLVAGDSAAAYKREKALSDRKNLTTMRPTPSQGRSPKASSAESISQQVAAELRERIAQLTI